MREDDDECRERQGQGLRRICDVRAMGLNGASMYRDELRLMEISVAITRDV